MNTSPSDHIPQEAFDWYDEYAHGLMDRRTFMKKLGGLAALGFSMAVLTSALLPNYALAEQVSFNDDDITATYEEFDSPNGHGKGKGYLATPKNIEGKLPVVLVVHENRGLILQVNTLGGQINNSEFEVNSSYPHRAFPYLGELQAYPNTTKQQAPLVKAFQEIQTIFTNNGIDRHYRNYPDINFDNWEYAYYRDNYAKLQSIKKKYDPNNVIWHDQSVKV